MIKLVVLSCLLAACSAGVPLLYGSAVAYSAPWLAPYNYRGPLSLAPGQPANVLGADGRPLDTLDVNLDRAAHYSAKLLLPHVLKKRSAPLLASPLLPRLPLAARPLVATTYLAPRIVSLPYATPLIRY